MSLIIAQKLEDFQIWCCDGLVIVDENDRLHAVNDAIDKIYHMVSHNVAIGISGNCYDAAEILRLAAYHKHIFSIEYFADDLAQIVAHVNISSERMRGKRGLPKVKTGLIAGGFINSTSFLFIIGPDGQIITAPTFAVVGAGLSSLDALAIKSIASCTQLEDSISKQKALFDVATAAQAVDGIRQIVMITPEKVTGCSAVDSAHMNSAALNFTN